MKAYDLIQTGALEQLRNSGKLQEVLPELAALVGLEGGIHHSVDGFTHTVDVMRVVGTQDQTLALAAMLHDVGKPSTAKPHPEKGWEFIGHAEAGVPIAAAVMERLGIDAGIQGVIKIMVAEHMALRSSGEEITEKAVRKFVKRCGDPLVARKALMLGEADWKVHPGADGRYAKIWPIFEAIIKEAEKPKEPAPLVSGKDIMEAFGLKPGPEVGKMAKLAKEIQAAEPTLSKEEILGRLKA